MEKGHRFDVPFLSLLPELKVYVCICHRMATRINFPSDYGDTLAIGMKIQNFIDECLLHTILLNHT